MNKQINKLDYILEIKGLKYDKLKLLQIADDFGITSFVSNEQTTLYFASKNDYDIYSYNPETGYRQKQYKTVHLLRGKSNVLFKKDNSGNKLFKQLKDVDYKIQSQAYEIIKSIIEQFDPILQPAMHGQFLRFPKGFKLPKHTDDGGIHGDKGREAMIHISLTDETSPIEFYDGDRLLFEHEYTGPTIVNTQKTHSIKVPTQNRISFQLTFDTGFLNRQLWKNLLLLHDEGKILN